jgi:hypothetical protein
MKYEGKLLSEIVQAHGIPHSKKQGEKEQLVCFQFVKAVFISKLKLNEKLPGD